MSGAPPGKGSKIEQQVYEKAREREEIELEKKRIANEIRKQQINERYQNPVRYRPEPPRPRRMLPPGPPPLSEQNPSSLENINEITQRAIRTRKIKQDNIKPKQPKKKKMIKIKSPKERRRRLISQEGEPEEYEDISDSTNDDENPTIQDKVSSSEEEEVEYVEEYEAKDAMDEVISNPNLRAIEEAMELRYRSQQARNDYYERRREEQDRKAEAVRKKQKEDKEKRERQDRMIVERENRLAQEEQAAERAQQRDNWYSDLFSYFFGRGT
jgi:hypothetical protein